MNTIQIVTIIIGITFVVLTIVLIWLWKANGQETETEVKPKKSVNVSVAAEEEVDHIFNKEFREELRNRGRLHFEKVIGENAMFLQQDLRLTTSQLNDYMKQEIKKVLEDEFSKYEDSIKGAKELALQSIQKTQSAIDQQREMLEKKLVDEVDAEKTRIINKFETNMTDIVNHYILAAVGSQIDLTSQIEYITYYLNENKQAILEDIKHGS